MPVVDLRPPNIPITAVVGDDITLTFTATDATTGLAVDLSTISFDVPVLRGSTVADSFTPTVSGVGNNILTVTLASAKTTTIGVEGGLRWTLNDTTNDRHWAAGEFRLWAAGSSGGSSPRTFNVNVGATISAEVTVIVGTGGGGGGGVTDHGALTGRGDDDHTQYALANGTRGTFEVAGAAATAKSGAEATAAAALAGHVAAGDPHPGYLTAAEGNAAYDAAGAAAAAQAASQPLDADLTALAAANNSVTLAATTASFLTADETKLDGIETAATADQTAAEILAKLVTVDGAGSGLDADLLDGISSAGFHQVGGTEVPVTDGGTGASTAANARTNLGLVIGTDVQAYDAELASIAGLTSAADRLPYFTGSGTATLATFTAAGRALVDDADAAAQRTTLGVGTLGTFTALDLGQTAGNTETAGSITTSKTLALATYTDFVLTMTGNTTFSISGAPTSGKTGFFSLQLLGAFTPTFWAGVKWQAGTAPTYVGTGQGSLFVFKTSDGGTTWLGRMVGSAFA